jgi:outer membrane protein OmpA-like peptidoglycan-associated protein
MFGIQVSLGWTSFGRPIDDDHDGVVNERDKCPRDPEDKDKFKDEDGCPDIDNDNDGVLDLKDKCPNEPTAVDGCPSMDADRDGIQDKDDHCPKKAEDLDKFLDEDGCPEEDNDQDGILDKDDNCPNKAEDKDGFNDNDGCPDIDNDGDGVNDVNDKCPGQKGPVDNSGCPRAQEIMHGEPILLNVSFQTGRAELTVNSFTILDQVVESLKEWQDIKLEIQGHTDNVGGENYNMRLSQARAKSVVNHLISKGIAPDRLRAVGFGFSRPIADNKTALGRERNRRVEIRRID